MSDNGGMPLVYFVIPLTGIYILDFYPTVICVRETVLLSDLQFSLRVRDAVVQASSGEGVRADTPSPGNYDKNRKIHASTTRFSYSEWVIITITIITFIVFNDYMIVIIIWLHCRLKHGD